VSIACPSTYHRHDPAPVACEGCGTTTGVTLTRRRGAAPYGICDRCWDRGRKGWFRPETKADRIAAVERAVAGGAS
jgi:hypothetical protein